MSTNVRFQGNFGHRDPRLMVGAARLPLLLADLDRPRLDAYGEGLSSLVNFEHFTLQRAVPGPRGLLGAGRSGRGGVPSTLPRPTALPVCYVALLQRRDLSGIVGRAGAELPQSPKSPQRREKTRPERPGHRARKVTGLEFMGNSGHPRGARQCRWSLSSRVPRLLGVDGPRHRLAEPPIGAGFAL